MGTLGKTWKQKPETIEKKRKYMMGKQIFKGRKHTEETKEKMRESKLDEKNHSWKGDEVGYVALHQWVYRKLGQPSKCDKCGTTEKMRYEWHNLSGNYYRHLADWQRLCVSCHNKIKVTNRKSNNKTFYQIKNNKVINSFKSVMDAERETGVLNSNICTVLGGKRDFAGGYRWSYKLTNRDK